MAAPPCLRFLSLLPAILGATSAFALDPACKAVADANDKLVTVPVHIYSNETAVGTGGRTRSSEIIYLTDKTYVFVNGKWRVSPIGRKETEAARKQAEAASTVTCRQVREESVNGEAAVLYSTHNQTQDAKFDTQLWISKSRGLPLKAEMDMDVGGAAGKTHRTMRYEYTNVQAPAGVQ